MATLRIYLRRSKADTGHQEFSLDVQRDGCRRFTEEMGLPWSERVEYVDDDRAGDDFLGRTELRRLLADTKAGDVVVVRDQSRIGREAVEVTLVVRDLVLNRGARLFYYSTNQEVAYRNAIDAAMTFIQGTGHQLELEAIRSRTREALRARVRAGRIAGGRCFGYVLTRNRDESGREYTTASIDEKQADIVRRVFRNYLDGLGLKRIASSLNSEHIPSPHAGRRGTGSWSTSMIHSMLRNERYRGVYTHGRTNRVRKGGKRIARAASPHEIIRVEIPAWQIIDDITWFAVQKQINERKPRTTAPGPACRYTLSGLAKCGVCGGAIGGTRTKHGGKVLRAYACTWHHTRGRAICPVSVRQPTSEVEAALANHLQALVLQPAIIERLLSEVREEVKRVAASEKPKVEHLEVELRNLKTEQRNLANAIAIGGAEVPELVSAMHTRTARIQKLEADIAVARRATEMTDEVVAKVENAVRSKLSDLGSALAKDPAGTREVYLALFPDGLKFTPVAQKRRNVWKIQGMARLDSKFKLNCDPTGT